MDDYASFIERKSQLSGDYGFDPVWMPDMLFPFQVALTRWALKKGRAAIFADCGLGKTPMQLAWSENVVRHTGGKVLILAPLAVSQQTIREGVKFGVKVNHASDQSGIADGVNITNYEKLHKFDTSVFSGVVLDESSILKAFMGKTKRDIITRFEKTPYKLACTATPAPNDFMELGNHCEFLGVMRSSEMLAAYFINDPAHVGHYRIKGHAQSSFWEWMCSWSVNMRKPSDIGFEDDSFALPQLVIHEHVVSEEKPMDGFLFAMPASSLTERRNARKNSIDERVRKACEIANASKKQWLIWCNLNDESKRLTAGIDGAVEVTGSDSEECRIAAMSGFSDGSVRCLVTKPTIAGFGMNWQHCANMIFVGLSDSYEQFYQATRRCWRFGQKQRVHSHIITAATEGAVAANIKRKEEQAKVLADGMVDKMSDISTAEIKGYSHFAKRYNPTTKLETPCFMNKK